MTEKKERKPYSYEAFMCGTDFLFEAGAPTIGNRFFADIDDLKRECHCNSHCGVVKVRITGVEVVEQNRWNDVEVDYEVRDAQ